MRSVDSNLKKRMWSEFSLTPKKISSYNNVNKYLSGSYMEYAMIALINEDGSSYWSEIKFAICRLRYSNSIRYANNIYSAILNIHKRKITAILGISDYFKLISSRYVLVLCVDQDLI